VNPTEPSRRVVVEDGLPTVAAVVRELTELSWTKARGLVETGRVRVDGAQCFEPATRLTRGAVVEIDPTGKRRRAPLLEPERLVYVDPELVVVNKPAGLITVAYDEQDRRDSLIERTALALLEREPHARTRGKGGERLGVVQRLDKDTTGLLVFARTRRARKGLEAQFRAHSVERRYVALVWGRAEAAVHDTVLVADRGDGLRGSWRGPKPPKAGKRAVTKVRVEERLHGSFGEVTLISCRLETGRQHQIRIHLAEAGNPLLGEPVYAGARARALALEVGRPMLHAASLSFRHPGNERTLRFESPLAPDFARLLESLRAQSS
jgi:23S rRNA pseudouridine1911/1915/1917 synthase